MVDIVIAVVKGRLLQKQRKQFRILGFFHKYYNKRWLETNNVGKLVPVVWKEVQLTLSKSKNTGTQKKAKQKPYHKNQGTGPPEGRVLVRIF